MAADGPADYSLVGFRLSYWEPGIPLWLDKEDEPFYEQIIHGYTEEQRGDTYAPPDPLEIMFEKIDKATLNLPRSVTDWRLRDKEELWRCKQKFIAIEFTSSIGEGTLDYQTGIKWNIDQIGKSDTFEDYAAHIIELADPIYARAVEDAARKENRYKPEHWVEKFPINVDIVTLWKYQPTIFHSMDGTDCDVDIDLLGRIDPASLIKLALNPLKPLSKKDKTRTLWDKPSLR